MPSYLQTGKDQAAPDSASQGGCGGCWPGEDMAVGPTAWTPVLAVYCCCRRSRWRLIRRCQLCGARVFSLSADFCVLARSRARIRTLFRAVDPALRFNLSVSVLGELNDFIGCRVDYDYSEVGLLTSYSWLQRR